MKPKVYLTPSAKTNLASQNKYNWIHLYSGAPVPPIGSGSFNFLINELLTYNNDHLLISRYYEESYKIAESTSNSIVYIDYKPKITIKSKIKRIFTGIPPINFNDFLKESFKTIEQLDCDKIIVWGTPNYLDKLKRTFPQKTIVYAQRFFEHAYPISNAYKYCDILLTQTHGTAKFAFDNNYAITPLILTIPNGVETNQFIPSSLSEKTKLKSELGIDPNSFVILWPSKLNSNKGISYLLHWINYFKKINPHIHFLICGESNNKNINENEIIFNTKFSSYSNVTFTGNVPRKDMPKIYRSADLSLMTGVLREGMSMSTQESLSSGLPVIATKRGTYPEIIQTNYNGILCNPENLYIEGIKAIEKYYANPKLLGEMAFNARNYAVKRLTRQRCIDNFNHFFNGEYSKIDNDLSI